MIEFIQPDWPAPQKVCAFQTTRNGGVSKGHYNSLNLAHHVADDVTAVTQNRTLLSQQLSLPSAPFWLQQVHSNQVVNLDNISSPSAGSITADSSYSTKLNKVCVVMTADCLPILLTTKDGSWVAACHAGWRGLLNGIIENTVATNTTGGAGLMAWIGPAISQPNFEVGAEVYSAFTDLDCDYGQFFKANDKARFWFDLIGLARFKLTQLGSDVYGGQFCSYAQPERFYSYRRDSQTGRMASLIWLAN
ncbi:peptidoglycan editing factor PgeF [Aliikangiella sp. IMCC44653]